MTGIIIVKKIRKKFVFSVLFAWRKISVLFPKEKKFVVQQKNALDLASLGIVVECSYYYIVWLRRRKLVYVVIPSNKGNYKNILHSFVISMKERKEVLQLTELNNKRKNFFFAPLYIKANVFSSHLRYPEKAEKIGNLDGCNWWRCADDTTDNFLLERFAAATFIVVSINVANGTCKRVDQRNEVGCSKMRVTTSNIQSFSIVHCTIETHNRRVLVHWILFSSQE